MGGPFDRLKFRDARACANVPANPIPPFFPLFLASSSSFSFSTETLLSTSGKRRRERDREKGRGKKRGWDTLAYISRHFAESRENWNTVVRGTLCSVAELAGDFIEVDLDRSARPEERLQRAKEEPLSETGLAFLSRHFLSMISFRWPYNICCIVVSKFGGLTQGGNVFYQNTIWRWDLPFFPPPLTNDVIEEWRISSFL